MNRFAETVLRVLVGCVSVGLLAGGVALVIWATGQDAKGESDVSFFIGIFALICGGFLFWSAFFVKREAFRRYLSQMWDGL